ncbi:hypothetical protein Trydic_g21423 [Trypoxylus dichotomus]
MCNFAIEKRSIISTPEAIEATGVSVNVDPIEKRSSVFLPTPPYSTYMRCDGKALTVKPKTEHIRIQFFASLGVGMGGERIRNGLSVPHTVRIHNAVGKGPLPRAKTPETETFRNPPRRRVKCSA